MISHVEFYFLDFCETGDVFKDGAFMDLLYMICVDSIQRVGYDQHYQQFISNIIYDYCITRFKYVGKAKQVELCGTRRTLTHFKRKMSKVI